MNGVSPMAISEIKLLIDRGKYPQALETIETLTGEERIEGLILKNRILQRKGEVKEALATGNEILNESRASGKDLLVLKTLLTLGFVHANLLNKTELNDILREAEEIFSQIKIEEQEVAQEYQGALAFLQGNLEEIKGEIEKALELLEKSLVIRQALPYRHEVVDTLTKIGFIHLD
jgi:tetratricopeptide (TPR) repeat protein